jgi:glutathione S-transferase
MLHSLLRVQLTMKLYTNPLSGYCHRAELLLSLLSLEYDRVLVDRSRSTPRPDDFLVASPWRQAPILIDDAATIIESTAILVYLAKKTAASHWLPQTPLEAALVETWLSRASGAGISGLSHARLIRRFGARGDLARAQKGALWLLEHMNRDLGSCAFLAADAPTLADVAMYAYVAAADEGGIDLGPFARIIKWLASIERLPGFVPFEHRRFSND